MVEKVGESGIVGAISTGPVRTVVFGLEGGAAAIISPMGRAIGNMTPIGPPETGTEPPGTGPGTKTGAGFRTKTHKMSSESGANGVPPGSTGGEAFG